MDGRGTSSNVGGCLDRVAGAVDGWIGLKDIAGIGSM